MSVQIAKRYFSVGEYNRIAETVFSEDDRVELIEGEIVEMSPIGSRHAACVKRLNKIFNRHFNQTAVVSVQDPIVLDDFSEPQPDVALLRPREDFYEQEHPTASDVLLVVEVADTSIAYDHEIKLPLYARAGVPEVWLVDLANAGVEIYAEPANGEYQFNVKAKRGATIESHTIAALKVDVDAILG